jgi:hypothetical protein
VGFCSDTVLEYVGATAAAPARHPSDRAPIRLATFLVVHPEFRLDFGGIVG